MDGDPAFALFTDALAALARVPRHPLCLDATPELAAVSGPAPERWTAIQPWRPEFLALQAGGFTPRPTLAETDRDFDIALVRLGRNRARSLAAIAEACARITPEGLVLVAGANALGAASYARHVGASRSLARRHGRVFWFGTADAPPAARRSAWIDAARLAPQGADGHVAAPGVFAWDRVDAGSRLLAESLPATLAGRIADLGAGWGYLTAAALARCTAITAVDLYEADALALAAARATTAALPPHRAVLDFHWHDATRSLPRGDYDAILANPPFHDDRVADPRIGQAFIRTAAAALRPGGTLWLVANRHLPYEATLASAFARVAPRAKANGYKVFAATR